MMIYVEKLKELKKGKEKANKLIKIPLGTNSDYSKAARRKVNIKMSVTVLYTPAMNK